MWKVIFLVGGLMLIVGVILAITAKTTYGTVDMYEMSMSELKSAMAAGESQRNMGIGIGAVGGFFMIVGFVLKPNKAAS